MKIAIFHNYMDNIGGAEIVCLTLAKELNADLYTTNIDREKIKKMGFSNVNIISIGKIPINAPLKQQSALRKFRKLNLKNKYDFYIIGGDWAISGAVNNKPNLWYVHSPIREIWDSYDYTRRKIVKGLLKKHLFGIWAAYNRRLNKKYVKHAEKIICNSENTKNRVEKFLKRDSKVINPPIDTSKYRSKKNGNYWLSVNRLIYNKRIEIQTNAFSKMPNEKLIVIGSYEKSKHFLEYAKKIMKTKPKNVELKSWVNSTELINLYANCKGFITTSRDEDFGMTPIEAMASGKPVIAPNEGGYKETITNKTGKLINNINPNKLIKAIKELGTNTNRYKAACLKQAKKFDKKVFIKKIKGEIK